MRAMSKTNEMVEELEKYIIQKVKTFDEITSPEEIEAIARLVDVVNRTPREIEGLWPTTSQSNNGILGFAEGTHIINASAVTEATLNRQRIEGTESLTSKDLAGVEHSKISLLLYYLISNGSERSVDDFELIGKFLHSFAAQLAYRKE
ncbi:hypothetical protein ABD89_13670 [Lysinibacillus sphaericus]|nr:hypothetical protein [Lysinibacillus sphaericus]